MPLRRVFDVATSLFVKRCCIKYLKNKGKNKSGINFTEIDKAKTIAAHFHLPECNKYKLHTKKNIIIPSKCRFPESSIIINGLSKYQNIL